MVDATTQTPPAGLPLGLAEEEIDRLPATLDIVTAGRLLGIGQNKSRDLANAGQFPVETFKVGRQHKVSKHLVLIKLGLRSAA